jgi:hypothetical protein
MLKTFFAPVRSQALQVISLLCGMTIAATASATSLSRLPDPLFHDSFAGISAGPTTDSDASRFLAQATFGPTDADIAYLKSKGYQAWLNEQFAATPTLEMDYFNWIGNTLQEDLGQNKRQEAWFRGALGGPDPQFPSDSSKNHTDQLRQRVAFALSEIFVVSDQNPTLEGFSPGMTYYYDILVKDAFGNYRQLLEDVTLSPAMGVYLNMLGNQRADSSQNLHPDENYGREINQLFSIGLVMLNQNGTVQSPVTATYTQSVVTDFAHVFTGFTWYDCDEDTNPGDFPGCGPDYGGDGQPPFADNFVHPMKSFASYHDNGTHADDLPTKTLLSYNLNGDPSTPNNPVLGSGGTPTTDLKFALDNIFNHPNVAPFISKQLIQRLVTSNPSPEYVARVAGIFANDGTGVRGNLKAVVQAILLDQEARYGQLRSPDTFGKLREPLLVMTHYWRAMHATHVCGQNIAADGDNAAVYYDNPYRYAGGGTTWSTGQVTSYGVGVDQASLDAPTVFNFFKPSYMPAGEMTTRGLLGPEFQLQTDSVIASSTNSYISYANYYDIADSCDNDQPIGDVKIDHAQDVALAGSGQGGPTDPADRLVDEYSKRFMSGQMSPFMRNELLTDLNQIDHFWAYPDGSDWRLQRIYRALYLILTSPEYMVQK